MITFYETEAKQARQNMAARKMPLTAPAEFTKKHGKAILKKADNCPTVEKQVLHPPSEYKLVQLSDIEDKGKHLDNEGTDLLKEERGRICEKSSQLFKDIQESKEQNALLDNLTKQIESLLAKKHESSTIDLSKLTDIFSEIQKSQEQNKNVHVSFQKHAGKQAKALEKLTEQFLDRQNELAAENGKLRKKFSMMSEETKEMKFFLEKEIEAKEKTIATCLLDLKKVQQNNIEIYNELDQNKQIFSEALNKKDGIINDLNEKVNHADMENKKLCEQSNIEKEMLLREHGEELVALKVGLEKRNEELRKELEWYKESWESNKEEYDVLKAKLVETAAKSESLKQELKNTLKDFENCKIESSNGKLENSLTISNLKEKLENQKSSHIAEMEMMKTEHKLDKESYINALKDLKEKFEGTAYELQNANKQVEDLHAFVADKISESNVKRYECRIQNLGEENLQLKETCKSLESAIELLNVRVLSLNNIIKIQEDEIKSGSLLTGDKSSNLMSKWRDKVYSLLVQLKSQEIMEKEDIYKLKRKLQTHTSQIKESDGKISLLTNQLTEKSAELKIKTNEVEKLTKERDFSKENRHKAETECSKYKEGVSCLVKNIESLSSFIHTNIEKADKGIRTLKTLDGRINFANERLRVVRELFNRRMVLLKANCKMKHPEDGNDADLESSDGDQESSSPNRNSLMKEVENLTKERQLLLKQVKEDTDRLSNIKKEFQFEYESKIANREDRINELEEELQLQKTKNEEIRAENETFEMTKIEMQEELETLKADLRRAQTKFDKELEIQLEVQKQHHHDEVSELQQVINDTQREHTKTIVSLRQLERQLSWQKQNATELIKQNEEVHNYEIEKLKRKAIELEKERNVLLATVKQENLKMPRSTPAGFDATSDTDGAGDGEKRVTRHRRANRETPKSKRSKTKSNDIDHGKLSGMLKELRSISASLLQEENLPPKPDTVESVDNNSTSKEF